MLWTYYKAYLTQSLCVYLNGPEHTLMSSSIDMHRQDCCFLFCCCPRLCLRSQMCCSVWMSCKRLSSLPHCSADMVWQSWSSFAWSKLSRLCPWLRMFHRKFRFLSLVRHAGQAQEYPLTSHQLIFDRCSMLITRQALVILIKKSQSRIEKVV